MEPTRRELRQQKRDIKRAGGKRRRRQLKKGLAENPEDAPHTEFDFGRYSSAAMNGLDRDPTRRRTSPPAEEGWLLREGPETGTAAPEENAGPTNPA